MPALTELAQSGVSFTNFHTSPTCSVTRSMLLTGANTHEIGLGTFDYAVYPDSVGKPGYEGYLTQNAVTIATLLKDNGYNTFMTGKWHLGKKSKEHYPPARGFVESYGILAGGSNHYDRTIMFPGKDPSKVGLEVTYRNGEAVKDEYVGTFSDDVYTKELIGMIDKYKGEEKPFFAYLALTAVHLPLQAPKELISKYEKDYMAGWDKIRKTRFERMKAMGIIDKQAKFSERNPTAKAWDSLDSEKQMWEARKFATIAAMLEKTDASIKQLSDYLKSIGEYDNTFIVYTSDNGPETFDVYGNSSPQAIRDWVAANFDNSYENMGTASSNISLGASWANASTGGLSWFKGYTAEGGLRVPLIVKPHNDFAMGLEASTKTNEMSQVRDLANTFLDLAQVQHPGSEYKGRKVATAKGTSLLPFLEGKTDKVHSDEETIGFELFGSGIILQGDYKIIRISTGNGGDNKWHLYNTKLDPAETTDLKDKMHERFASMRKAYDEYADKHGIIPVDPAWNPYKNVK